MSGHRGNVTVVEDDYSVSHAITRLLEAAGFHTRVFGSAEAMLVDETAQQADCLILDLHLPGMSGAELYAKLAANGISAPIVIITAHDDAEHRHAAQTIGAAAYLTKPFVRSSLINAVTRAMQATPPASPRKTS